MLDQNKTALTHRITAIAAAYLDGLGCKPVETEVPVAAGWVADVASYWYPTQTEAKRFKLHKRVRSLILRAGQSEVDFALWLNGDGPLTVIVEVKSSRADFMSDRKWQLPFPAHLCLLAYPYGVIERDEIPAGWDALETSKDGSKLRKVITSHSAPHAQYMALTLDFVAQVGIRRDHRTRYRAAADWLKAYNATERGKRTTWSAARLLDGLASWLQGNGWKPERPLRDILAELGIKKLPRYAEPAIAFLETLRNGASDYESDAKK